MHIILFIVGGLLALFGGGCLLTLGTIAAMNPVSALGDIGFYLGVGLPLGVLPLIGGIAIIRRTRYGKRKTSDEDPPAK